MAIFNEILVGRYNRAIQKLFGIKGSPPVRQVGGEVMPTISIYYGAENRFLETWYRYGKFIDNLPQAGLTTAVRFRNPANSGVIAVLEKVTLFTSLQTEVQMRFRDVLADADLSSPVGGFPMERRLGKGLSGGSVGSIRVSTDLAGSQAGTSFNIYRFAPNISFEQIPHEDHQIVVDPGQWFQWFIQDPNIRFSWSAIWRERQIEESELI